MRAWTKNIGRHAVKGLMRWSFALFLLSGFTYICATYFIFGPEAEFEEDVEQRKPLRDQKKHVVIYAATKFFRMNITTERFLPECHSTKGFCRITENPADLESADAVLFHNADYSAATVPKPRKLSRPHVLWSLESPSNDFFRPESHVINWTMTFRRDADIWYPYGHFRKLPESVTVDYDAIWKIKKATPPAVWLASNCFARNKRTQIVQELEKQGLKVNKFGQCGVTLAGCDGVDKQDDPCVANLLKPYKFYIALENSNCVDYVTEKFYQTLISRVAIPIVLKRDIYLNVGVPKDSFIAIDDFPTIADLVRYVHEVADDKEKYLSYHRWRETYEVIPEHNDYTGFCELCRRLQQSSVGYMTYDDVRKWHADNQCDNSYASKYIS